MEQKDVYNDMDKLQIFIKGHKANPLFPYIVAYPVNASTLPEIVGNTAYPDGLPVEVVIPELGMILGDKKMRGRNTNDMPWLAHVPEEHRAMFLAQMGTRVAATRHPGAFTASAHVSPVDASTVAHANASFLRHRPTIGLMPQTSALQVLAPNREPKELPPMKVEQKNVDTEVEECGYGGGTNERG